MSDLQCPATLLLVRPAGGDLQPADALAERLRLRRVAAVLSGPAPQDRRTADRVARALGLTVGEVGAGGTALDLGTALGLRTALADVADLYRGETVVVVLGGVDLAAALPALAADAPADLAAHPLPECGVAEVAVDADGWALQAWPGLRGA